MTLIYYNNQCHPTNFYSISTALHVPTLDAQVKM